MKSFIFKNSLYKFARKAYFTYPCPRKLDQIVKMSLFEKEQPFTIKQIWNKFFEDKPTALGLDISGGEMNIIIKKYIEFNKISAQSSPFFILPVKRENGYYILVVQNQEKSFVIIDLIIRFILSWITIIKIPITLLLI